MELLIQRAQEAASLANHLKGELINFYQNDEHSFEDRWEAFMAWYKLGGDSGTYIYHGWDNLIPGESDPIGYDCLVHCDRYQTVDLVDTLTELPERLFDNLSPEQQEAYEELDGMLTKQGLSCSEIQDKLNEQFFGEILNRLKEQLMSDAISEFNYDW